MLRLILFAVAMSSASALAADVSIKDRVIEAHLHLVQKRCPTVPFALTAKEIDQFAEVISEKIASGQDFEWNAFFEVWEAKGRPYIAGHHAMAFLALAKVQQSLVSAHIAYLGDGTAEGDILDPNLRVERALSATELLKCVTPNEDEMENIQALEGKNGLLVAKAKMIIECSNWIEMSNAVLALDTKLAGTTEIQAATSKINSEIFRAMDGIAFKRCEEEYLQ
jgi:hypothetical protein